MCPSFSPWFSTQLDTLGLCPLPRIKVKKGLHVTAARPAQPSLWTAKLDRFKGSKHHTTLITCHRAGTTGPDSRWATLSLGARERREQIFSGAQWKGAPGLPPSLLPSEHAQSTPSRKQHRADTNSFSYCVSMSGYNEVIQLLCIYAPVQQSYSATVYPCPQTASVYDLVPGDASPS